MKKLTFLGFATILLAASISNTLYSQVSSKFGNYNNLLSDAISQNWDSYSEYDFDTDKKNLKVNKINDKSLSQTLIQSNETTKQFSWIVDKGKYEMPIYDTEETPGSFGASWNDAAKTPYKLHELPIHKTPYLITENVLREDRYWEQSTIVNDMISISKNLNKKH